MRGWNGLLIGQRLSHACPRATYIVGASGISIVLAGPGYPINGCTYACIIVTIELHRGTEVSVVARIGSWRQYDCDSSPCDRCRGSQSRVYQEL